MAKSFSSRLCLLNEIVVKHAMGEKMFNDFLIRKCTWISHVRTAYSILDLQFLYVLEPYVTMKLKSLVQIHESIF